MIHMKNVSKYYPTPKGRKYVLKDVTFDLDRLCNVGIIGRNGAGKSTLIKMLGGVDYPNKGRVHVDGRISWPMGLSAGTQGSLTGADNARFVCRIYGDSEQQIEKKMGFIRKYSGLGNYFDMPVKTYSSGMRSRLTFWTSMAFDFEIYLMDEIGAVGDRQFKKRSVQALKERKDAAHIIKVSHSMDELIKECDVGLYLHDGKVSVFDDIRDAVDAYETEKV